MPWRFIFWACVYPNKAESSTAFSRRSSPRQFSSVHACLQRLATHHTMCLLGFTEHVKFMQAPSLRFPIRCLELLGVSLPIIFLCVYWLTPLEMATDSVCPQNLGAPVLQCNITHNTIWHKGLLHNPSFQQSVSFSS